MVTLQLEASDGVSIWLYRWLPVDVVRGVIIISHGLSEHGQRYQSFAEALCRAGYAVYAFDHRGHGAHAEQAGWFAEEAGWARVLADLAQVRQTVAVAHPETPLILFGHSMGSFVARAYFLREGAGLSALVLSATGYRQGVMARLMRRIARVTGKVCGKRVASRFLARLVFGGFNLTFRPRRTAVDWLSRDPREVDRYLADPLCAFFPTPALWIDLFGGVIEMEHAEKHARNLPFSCPVLLLAGSRDPVSLGTFGLNQLARRYRKAGLSEVDVRVYPGGRHEMHNETNREEVMRDLIVWLQSAVRPATGASRAV
jgi:alpha-beta hydrolase superfamily lysophospholipase